MGQHQQHLQNYLPSLGYGNIPKFLHCVANVLWKVVEKLGLLYSTSKELNDIIDKGLPGPPSFQCMNLSVGSEDLEFHYRELSRPFDPSLVTLILHMT